MSSLNNDLRPWPRPFLVRFFRLLLKCLSLMISTHEYSLDNFLILLNYRRANFSSDIGLYSINWWWNFEWIVNIGFDTMMQIKTILRQTLTIIIFFRWKQQLSMFTSVCDGGFKFCYESRAFVHWWCLRLGGFETGNWKWFNFILVLVGCPWHYQSIFSE